MAASLLRLRRQRVCSVVVSTDFEIRHLFVSSGHNFFGHHQKPPSEHLTLEVDEVRCLAGKGIVGDRFFCYKPDYAGQITFFEEEVYLDLCRRLKISDRGPAVFRRNVITQGVRLNDLIGVDFESQGIHFYGTQESRPCYWMDQAFGPGAEAALRGRGGLRARILSDGVLRRGVGCGSQLNL
jgi:MOSC domain-containing protein YiiM